MIFISGIHAVGKGYFCGLVKKELGIEAYSASDLIAKARNASFSSDKLVAEIEENQQYLLAAVQELRESGSDFILDGHFCLINRSTGEPERISLETFTTLKPEAIVLLTEKPKDWSRTASSPARARQNGTTPPSTKFSETRNTWATPCFRKP